MQVNSDKINFSHNWNNKLDCKAYTTFRIYNASKYQIGKTYKIYLKNQYLHDAVSIDIKILKLDKVNSFISYIDTGYSVDEFKNIVRKMYGEKAETSQFCLILLKKIEK